MFNMYIGRNLLDKSANTNLEYNIYIKYNSNWNWNRDRGKENIGLIQLPTRLKRLIKIYGKSSPKKCEYKLKSCDNIITYQPL